MKLFFLLALVSSSFLQGQVSIVIEDESADGFLLGVNGYLQTREKSSSLLIKNLDTSRYTFSIRSGTNEFSKQIQLREKGLHKYILTHDFYGHLKLRYRGVQSKAPEGITSIAVNEELKWPILMGTTDIAVQEIKLNETSYDSIKEDRVNITYTSRSSLSNKDSPSSPNSISTNSLSADDSPTSQETAPVAEPVEKTTTSSGSTDKVVNAEASDRTLIPAQNTSNVFNNFLEDLRAQEFEFDKLNMCQEYAAAKSLTSKQLGGLFEELSYDQSRMQLIRSNLKDISDPENLRELSIYFEYEITKSQFILFLNE